MGMGTPYKTDFMSLATLCCSLLVIAGVLMEELIHLRAVL